MVPSRVKVMKQFTMVKVISKANKMKCWSCGSFEDLRLVVFFFFLLTFGLAMFW
ncbi:unnamed protein product [Camellia sinensis]